MNTEQKIELQKEYSLQLKNLIIERDIDDPEKTESSQYKVDTSECDILMDSNKFPIIFKAAVQYPEMFQELQEFKSLSTEPFLDYLRLVILPLFNNGITPRDYFKDNFTK